MSLQRMRNKNYIPIYRAMHCYDAHSQWVRTGPFSQETGRCLPKGRDMHLLFRWSCISPTCSIPHSISGSSVISLSYPTTSQYLSETGPRGLVCILTSRGFSNTYPTWLECATAGNNKDSARSHLACVNINQYVFRYVLSVSYCSYPVTQLFTEVVTRQREPP